ncbi:hypothetical protein [Faecalimonas sp.]
MEYYNKILLMKLLNQKLHNEKIINDKTYEKMQMEINHKISKVESYIEMAKIV